MLFLLSLKPEWLYKLTLISSFGSRLNLYQVISFIEKTRLFLKNHKLKVDSRYNCNTSLLSPNIHFQLLPSLHLLLPKPSLKK